MEGVVHAAIKTMWTGITLPQLYPGLREKENTQRERFFTSLFMNLGEKKLGCCLTYTLLELSFCVPLSPGEAGRVTSFDYQS